MTTLLDELLDELPVREQRATAVPTGEDSGPSWARYLRERAWKEAPRLAPRRWHDEEGL